MRADMNYDSITDVRRRIARKNEQVGSHSGRQTVERAASLAVRLLTVLAVVLAVAWAGAVVVPALGGMFAAAMIGFVALWALPWLVVSGVVRVLETIE